MKQRKVRVKAEMVITLEPLHVKEITSQTVIEISFKATPRPIWIPGGTDSFKAERSAYRAIALVILMYVVT